MTDPLRVTLELDCSAAHAFDTWTQDFARWWPTGHTVAGTEDVAVVFEPRLGGRIFERTLDGAETAWGEITRWEPPDRLGYLWHLRRDRADATDVDIEFVSLGADRCRLEVVHTGWDRLGAEGVAWRSANQAGWSGLLPHFASAISASQPSRGGTR